MKKNLMSVLILVLLIVNIILSAVMMVSVLGTNKKTAELMDSIAMAMHLELNGPGSSSEVALSDTVTHDLGSMTIALAYSQVTGEDGNVTTSTKRQYIVFNISLAMNTKHKDYADYSETISNYDDQIKDTVMQVVSNYTSEECGEGFTTYIRDEILKAIQNMFKSEFIYRINLNDIKYG